MSDEPARGVLAGLGDLEIWVDRDMGGVVHHG